MVKIGTRHKSERQNQQTTATRETASTNNRSISNNNRASSDSEVAQGAGGAWAREKCHFHEGVDVDQLARYRRRRIEVPRAKHGLDIGITPQLEEEEEQKRKEDEKEKEIKEDEDEKVRRRVTEYRLAFRATSTDDVFRASRETTPRPKSQLDNVDNYSSVDPRASYNAPLTSETTEPANADQEDNGASHFASQKSQTRLDFDKIAEMGSDVYKRQAPIRRPTTLRYEGDFYSGTEYSTLFVTYPGNHRSELRRRGTSLRMEGDFEGRTENNDSFREWPVTRRPRPDRGTRLSSSLRLEGDVEARTECKAQYVPFVGARRPELLKRSSQLRIEGDDRSWTPEYADLFRGFDFFDRPKRKMPVPNLRPDGGFYDQTESKTFFTDPRVKEIELMKEMPKKRANDEEDQEEEEEERARLKKESEMRMLVSKLEDLKGPQLEIPEYKAAYKEFPRERAKLAKPGNEIGLSDGSKVPNLSPRHFTSKIDQDPEYKSMYVEHRPREPPPRGLPSRRPSASSSSVNNSPFGFHYNRRSRFGEPARQQPLTEIRSQYVDYGPVPRTETLRAPANLRLEGNLDMEPEYRTAFRDHRSSNPIQVAPAPSRRRSDRSLSASRRTTNGSTKIINNNNNSNGNNNNNYWIDNDNGDRFGSVNAGDQQDAFQVLHTRLHEESVVGKPPPSNRRNSRSSLARGSLDSERPRVRNRSPSPMYSRLQQPPSIRTDEDEEPMLARNFPRRRSRRLSPSLLVHPSNNRSPSPIVQKSTERAYSPSFAKEPSVSSRAQQAFVVLEDLDDGPVRHRTIDRSYDAPRPSNGTANNININNNTNVGAPLSGMTRNRSPSNWMPPWYDSSTSTI
ncbi:uncharacterized protein LOC106637273 [Copidosoma floridanum]|uniref:uncharacterized protein LOC106637273 n=1 Tax=Copidosoma floridanum TaxID=29053 RepID=UPI0006C9C817|nr:uncharacterized protein LOC106637273 [Copidosoma floridanum]